LISIWRTPDFEHQAIPQTIDHSGNERSPFSNFHASYSVHLDASRCIQHLDTASQLRHAYFSQPSQQFAHLIWLFKIV